MSTLLFILFLPVFSLNDTSSLGELYLSYGEFVQLYLSEYFEGNYLTYSITRTNMTNQELLLQHSYDFKFNSFVPYASPTPNEVRMNSRLGSFPSWSNDEIQVILGFHQNFILLYNLSLSTGDLQIADRQPIETGYNLPKILQIEFIQDFDSIDLPSNLIILMSQYDVNQTQPKMRHDVYMAGIDNFNNIVQKISFVGLNEITYASKVMLSSGSSLDHLIIYGEFSEENAIFVYDVTNQESPKLIQKIQQFFMSEDQFSIASVIWEDGLLYTLDTNSGFMVYDITSKDGLLKEAKYIDLSFCGSANSMWRDWNPFDDTKFTLSTENGFLIGNLPNSISGWVPGIDSNGTFSESLLTQYVGGFYFTQTSTDQLTVISNFYSSPRILFQVSIGEEVGDTYYEGGQWSIFQNPETKLFYYIRNDDDGIRVFTINITDWNLWISGDSSYYANIAAESENSGHKTINTITVHSIPADSQEILKAHNHRPTVIDPIEVSFVGDSSELVLTPTSYFSGPNMTFTLQASIPEYFEVSSSPIKKLSLFSSTSLPENVTNIEIIEDGIYYFYENGLRYESFADPYYDGFLIVSNPLKVTRNMAGTLVYWKMDDKFYISSFPPNMNTSIQYWNTEIECLYFFMNNENLICADQTQIDAYEFQFQAIFISKFSIRGEDFDGGYQWNITGLKSYTPSDSQNVYLLLLNNNEILYEINMIEIKESKPLYSYWAQNYVPQDVFGFTASESMLYFVLNDGTIYAFNFALKYERIIPTNADGQIISLSNVKDELFIYSGNELYIYNCDQPVHNTLFSSIHINQGCLTSISEADSIGAYIGILCPDKNVKNLEIYSVVCPNADSSSSVDGECILLSNIEIKIGMPKEVSDIMAHGKYSIIAQNGFSSTQVDIPLTFILDGELIWFKSQYWDISKDVPYNKAEKIDLSEIFFGQGLRTKININGLYIESNITQGTPAYVTDRIQENGFYNSTASDMFYSHTIITNTNLVIILSEANDILILDANNSEIGPLIALNISEYLNYPDAKCNWIDTFSHVNGDLCLLATSCSYYIDQILTNSTGNISIKTQIKSIVLWEFDYNHLKVTNTLNLRTSSQLSFLKIIAINSQDFEIIGFDTPLGEEDVENPNNNVLRFSGSWKSGTMVLKQLEILNFITLNLQSFFAVMVDGKNIDEKSTYYYVVDNLYGIRILKSPKDSTSELVQSIEVQYSDPLDSIGVCKNSVYARSFSGTMKRFKMINPEKLEVETVFNAYNTYGMSFLSQPCLIVCTENEEFIASSVWSAENSFGIRIWDTKTYNVSTIVSDLYVSHTYDPFRPASVKFLNSSTVTTIAQYGAIYKSYEINPNLLVIPKMSEAEYNSLVDSWGTSTFYIIITAENMNNSANTTVMLLKRSHKTNHQNEEIYWWVWFFAAIGFVTTAAGVWYGIRYLLRRKKMKYVAERPISYTDMEQLSIDL
ncbi:unnamed protein product [Blepharisma stoltei]|uniref:Uncharacterized protein n=1 Tax=Blepharisma stoltei TaxID=1481888 RepID=A0AAU9IK48_9CILI|nr:unnamed protein product [Blepharisma stoltei]